MVTILKQAATFVVAVFLCVGLLGAQTKKEEKSSQHEGGFSSSAVERTQKLSTTIKTATGALLLYEKSVSQEVSRGVSRINQSCTSTSSDRPLSPEIALSLRSHSSLLSRQKDNTLRKFNEVVPLLSQARDAQCRFALVPFMRSAACTAVVDLQSSAELIKQTSLDYFTLVEERYRLYGVIAAAESRGCLRPGFTERILRANEEHMADHEARVPVQFLDMFQSVSDLAKALN